MAFRELNPQTELSGFYLRQLSNSCQGYVRKFVPKKGGPFYIVELTAECKVQKTDKKTKKTVAGVAAPTQSIGISATKTLEGLQEYVGKEVQVRVTFKGETPCLAFPGKMIPLYKVEVDDSSD